jgi:phytoene synthase
MTEASRTLSRKGRSFAFASRLLDPIDRERVARVYAYCRATDDLVDEQWCAPAAILEARLAEWVEASRRSHAGVPTDVPVIGHAMEELRTRNVPFSYVEELAAGVRMDIVPRRYADFAELSTYTMRVAGVVGLMMCGMFDVRERWLTERAVTLGCAMQLTNIARDVGDDWDRGRLYLPQSLLRSYGVAERDLDAMRHDGRPITPGYRAVVESLLAVAEGMYRRSSEAVPYLPGSFRRTVAVASAVYRGIHDEIRRAGYDNLRHRAVTPLSRKCVLGIAALYDARGRDHGRFQGASADVA